MSKMPAKKKSCFQITSVTQAQVAANSATDDTESLDDPDESRTEDVSSEIFDVSRTDCEPEVCDRSSSEETLNNVCDSEGQLPPVAPLNGGLGARNSLPGGVQAIGAPQSGTSQLGQVTNSSSSTTIASCTSRFRVIKLDHGTGEPFRRGRWTCTEYYEKDQEGAGMGRTGDSIRHANVTEPGADRDSGLGATVGSVMAQVGVSGQGLDASFDGSPFSSPPYPLEPQQHSFNIALQQIAALGSPESFSNKSVPASVQQQVQGGSHVAVPQGLQPPVHDGAQIQKSPSMAPPQVQPLLYQPQQLPMSHHLQTQPALIPASQPDYGQQQMPVTIAQTHSAASLSVGHVVNQGPSPVQTPVAVGMQVLGAEMSGVPGGVQLAIQSLSSVPSLLQHPGVGLLSSIAPMPPGTSIQPQQYQAPGVLHGLPTALQTNQSMPTVPLTISSASGSALAGPTLPNLNTSAHNQTSQAPRNGTAVGMSTPGMPSSSFGQADESWRISDAFAQIPAVQNKDAMKPSITESLQLPNPAVNSLFGISIPIDGDDDR